jgi:hypothetical protein
MFVHLRRRTIREMLGVERTHNRCRTAKTMTRTKIFIPYRRITEELAPLVRGRVLHITCARNVSSILKAGGILGNMDGRFTTSFGSAINGFFRRRNMVSVFDYRSVSDARFEAAWGDCGPHIALRTCRYSIALLFVAPAFHDALVSWTTWKQEEAWEEMIVPDVEAGYPAVLPIAAIEDILEVRTRYYPTALERAIDAARKRNHRDHYA